MTDLSYTNMEMIIQASQEVMADKKLLFIRILTIHDINLVGRQQPNCAVCAKCNHDVIYKLPQNYAENVEQFWNHNDILSTFLELKKNVLIKGNILLLSPFLPAEIVQFVHK